MLEVFYFKRVKLPPFSNREMGQTGNVGWKLYKLTKGTKVGLRECGMQHTETYIKWWWI
jgi:hypothetical protein